jgi:hypothetical protein
MLLLLSASLFVEWSWFAPLRSPMGLLSTGGPMMGMLGWDMSMGFLSGVRFEEVDDEGRMGMDLCTPWWCGSTENGLRRASATEAISYSIFSIPLVRLSGGGTEHIPLWLWVEWCELEENCTE